MGFDIPQVLAWEPGLSTRSKSRTSQKLLNEIEVSSVTRNNTMNLKLVSTLIVALAIGAGMSPVRAAEPAKPESSAIKHVDADAAAKLVKDNSKLVVLDIRTPEEFAAGHIKGARNLDFQGDEFRQQLNQLAKDKTYLVHCASGGRSTKSLELFKKLEFKSLYHLDGGIKAWQKSGHPVEK